MKIEDTKNRIEELHTLLKLFDVPYLIIFDDINKRSRYLIIQQSMCEWIESYYAYLLSEKSEPWMIAEESFAVGSKIGFYYAYEYFSMMAVEYQVNRLTQGLAINSINQLPAEIMMKRDEYDG
jgi:hypothetical protein